MEEIIINDYVYGTITIGSNQWKSVHAGSMAINEIKYNSSNLVLKNKQVPDYWIMKLFWILKGLSSMTKYEEFL